MNANTIIKQVDHINIRIADIKKSVDFYTDILGFSVIGKRDMRPSANSVSTYVERDGVVLELAWGHDLSQCSSRGIMDHFALEVHDIHEAMNYFRKKEVNVISDVIPVNQDFLCFFLKGPSGETIEVIQYL